MLTVCNRTETAARIEHYFNQGDVHWPELSAPMQTLRVDSRVLEKAEIGETATADKGYEARLQGIVDAARIPETRRIVEGPQERRSCCARSSTTSASAAALGRTCRT
jgi:type III restriction enzyme